MKCDDTSCGLNLSGECLAPAWGSFCDCPASLRDDELEEDQ